MVGKIKYGFVVELNRKFDCMGFIRVKCGVGNGIKVCCLKKIFFLCFCNISSYVNMIWYMMLCK